MEILISLAILIVIVYLINQHFFSYWSKRGIPFKEPTFLVGELSEIFTLKRSLGDYFVNVYQKYKDQKILGLYFSYRPTLLVNDPLLIQDVMIKEFTSFHDRDFALDEVNDPLSGNLFGLTGQKWRDLRVKLSPTFTSGKLKGMYPTIRDCAKVMQDYMEKNVISRNDIFDIRDLLARFTTNVISSVAFGIENDCINDRENVFRKMGMKAFESSYKLMIRNLLVVFLPKVMKFLKIKQTVQEVEDFIMSVVKQSIEYREKNKDFVRKDFMELMIQLKNQGYLSVDKDEEEDILEKENGKEGDRKKLTFNEVAAQVFLFFIAGK